VGAEGGGVTLMAGAPPMTAKPRYAAPVEDEQIILAKARLGNTMERLYLEADWKTLEAEIAAVRRRLGEKYRQALEAAGYVL
jgi:hypothetical protein